jgi:hypothetical protein
VLLVSRWLLFGKASTLRRDLVRVGRVGATSGRDDAKDAEDSEAESGDRDDEIGRARDSGVEA